MQGGTQQGENSGTAITGEGSKWINDNMRLLNMASKGVNRARPEHIGRRPNGTPHTIFQVPDHLRSDEDGDLAPVYVRIGPFRQFDPDEHTPMQHYKWRCLRHLLSRHGGRERATQLLQQCLLKLTESDARVRSCYPSHFTSTMEPHKLALIMLLDACFIIHLLLDEESKKAADRLHFIARRPVKLEPAVGRRRVRRHAVEEDEEEAKLDEEIMEKKDMVVLDIGEEEEKIEGPSVGGLPVWNIVVFDLLKLDNQIPFFVIQTLFSLLRTPGDKDVDLTRRALELFARLDPNSSKKNLDQFNEKLKEPAGCSQVHHLLHLFHSSLVPPQTTPAPAAPHERGQVLSYSLPSATELMKAGVKLKKKENAASFLDITFEGRSLAIPPMEVHYYTYSLFRNLIVFEECFPDAKPVLKWYASFMACIIHKVEDAQFLDWEDIVRNEVGVDMEFVPNLFNLLCKQVHYDPHQNYLNDQFIKVNKYYRGRVAYLRRTYFHSPWLIVAAVPTTLALLLSIEQAVYAALSYGHQ